MSDFVFIPRVERVKGVFGTYLLREATCYDILVLTSIFSHISETQSADEVEYGEMRDILTPMLEDGTVSNCDMVEMASRLVSMSVDNLLLSNAKAKQSDPTEFKDAGMLRTLHVLGCAYGQDPITLAKRLTYRQAMLMFVLAHNDILNDRKIAGCDIKDKDYLNAWGLMCNTKGLSESNAMEYYGRQSRARREQAEIDAKKRGAK